MRRGLGQMFEFGEQKPRLNRKGESVTMADFILKFTCADWRVVQNGRIVLGSADHDGDEWFYNEDEPEEQTYSREAFQLANAFFFAVEQALFVVQSVTVSGFGEVRIELSGGPLIESFASSGSDLDLWWWGNELEGTSALVCPSGTFFGSR